MSLLRGVAEGVSRFVVRHASPGSKEWAEGLAREADFVENDWKALAWSLGSMRVLLSYREVQLRSLDDLSTEAEKYAERMRHRFSSTGGIWICNLLQTFCWSIDLAIAKRLQDRVGYSLLVFGFVMMTIHALILRRRAYDVPDRDDSVGLVQYYKTGLERVSSLQSLSFLVYGSFILVAGVGFTIVLKEHFFEFLIGFLWIAVIVLFFQKRQNNLRRLEEIETILRERN
jgi:hypothetical protein